MRFIGKALLVVFAVVGILASVLIVSGAVALSSFIGKDEPLPTKLVLDLDASGSFSEDGGALPGLGFLSGEGERPSLRAVTEGLIAAASDPTVKGLMVRIGEGSLGMAQAQELRQAILAFRASGKPSIAYAETIGEFGQGTVPYYLASAVEDVWLQPSGMLGTTGFAVRMPFVRKLLDDLGILPQFIARKEFKDAAATATQYGMSPAQEISFGALVQGWSGQVVRAVAEARGLSEDQVRGLIDRSPLLAAEALESGLIDRLGYPDEARKAMGERAGTDEHLSVGQYAERQAKAKPAPGAKGLALIAASGPIVTGDGKVSPFDGKEIDARALAATIDSAVDDAGVAAIVLRIDSPGGSYVGSDLVWRAVSRARQHGLPVIASMGDVAASGGYYMAMGANKIVAQPGTLTGSIGVVAGKFTIAKASEDLGIAWGGVEAGRNAALFSLTDPFDEAGQRRMDQILDAIYADFTGKAAAGRGLSPEAIEEAARGRVWTGEDALAHGLVDALGGLQTAIELARTEAGLDPHAPLAITVYPKREGPEWLLRALMSAEQIGGVRSVRAALGLVSGLSSELAPTIDGLRATSAGPLAMPVIGR
ncbi:S49 family peptidase [Rhodospirillum rubrum]|uniref:Peptidase S49 n=1 Tax=Rhodospirillum rubrum (strain ATCC 11170 / ATH 1.1.1 / DSM 467 / LMG 4362 / NCIMB 8255 / S1) TaxID=269796 RepID=Q2RR27_RHORT|nr:S49 family peptidase [Rhodospirillum rubrum]ABC23418.1 Peptidase S49 [Rhodospirillum rubrum ATCC 11170]AEO49156.1 peptidase S49 [Rhodospirillum rubrum F11]MBK5955088.1 peptidase S46 [Rhodospirillum rubrum]QXG79389.1 S49 family peptidase [Rhodospirillum rubrum]HAP98581.1 peptidase S46 [Rhodospirillum rubrum]